MLTHLAGPNKEPLKGTILMKSIAQIYEAVKNGQSLENLIPVGASLAHWRRLITNYDPAPVKRTKSAKRTTKHTPKQSKRSSYAKMQAALSMATLTLVERVNSEVKPPVSDSWYTVNTGEFVASVDRKTNEVSYQDE
jgi:hypothetical protein